MNRTIRHIAVHLALAAMMLRALLPAGWMPNAVQAGAPFVICTLHGALHLSGDPAPHKQQPDDGQRHDLCPFAAAPHLSSPAADAAIHAPFAIAARAFTPDYAAPAALRTAFSPQSPRAPPRSA
jgi:hypothetical protein